MLRIVSYLIVIFLISCSTQKENTQSLSNTKDINPTVSGNTVGNFDSLDLIKNKCTNLSHDNWQNTIKRSECIQDISTAVDSYLVQGNSPKALKIARFGMDNFGFNGEIKNSFKHAQSVFISATKMLIRDPNTLCLKINSRISYLRLLSPDVVISKNRCQNVSSSTQVDTSKMFKAEQPYLNRKYEHKAFDNLKQMLGYQLEQNNRDDYDNILIRGIKFWEGLNFYSESISFPQNTLAHNNKADLLIKAKTTYNESENFNFCSDIKSQFEFSNGNNIECSQFAPGGSKLDHNEQGVTVKKTSIKLGTKNYSKLSSQKFDKMKPSSLIFSLNFKSEGNVLKKYYYRRNQLHVYDPGTNSSYYIYYHGYNAMEPQNKTDPMVRLRIQEVFKGAKNTFFSILVKNIDVNLVNKTSQVELQYEPYLTYLTYKEVNKGWRQTISDYAEQSQIRKN